MRAAPATIGGTPRSSKRASERQSATSSRSPLHNMQRHRGLPVLKVVNFCAFATGIVELRIISTRDRPSFPAQGQRNDVKQQMLVARLVIAGKLICLNAAPKANHFIRFMSASGGFVEVACKTAHVVSALRPHQHHAVNLSGFTLASRNARLTAVNVRSTSGCVSVNCSRETSSELSCRSPHLTLIVAVSIVVNCLWRYVLPRAGWPARLATTPARTPGVKTRACQCSIEVVAPEMVSPPSPAPQTRRDRRRIDTSMSHCRGRRSGRCFGLFVETYATAAAVGSIEQPQHVQSRKLGGVFIVCRCASSKYAGTVMTAPGAGHRGFARRGPSGCAELAEISTGDISPLTRGDLELTFAVAGGRGELIAGRGITAQVRHTAAHGA